MFLNIISLTLVSVLDDKDDLVEEFGDIVNAKIELPIRKNHIDLLIDVFRKKRVTI